MMEQTIAIPAAPASSRTPAPARSLLNDPAFLALARAYEERARAIEPPLRATVHDVTRGHWYAVVLVPGREDRAIRRIADETWLPTYLPKAREVRQDRYGQRWFLGRALFVGYGFVLVENIDQMFNRITSFEGVLGILCSDGQPAVIRQRGAVAPADYAPRNPLPSLAVPKLGPDRHVMRFDHGLIEFIRRVEHAADGIATFELGEAEKAERKANKERRGATTRKSAKGRT